MKNKISPPPEPLDAATVILVREKSGGKAWEVLLMRRHEKQDFMGQAFVFPGGRLDPADGDPRLAEFATGISAEEAKTRLNETGLSTETALGLFFAAIRETFEESGVLLAVPASGGRIDFDDPGVHKRFAAYRKRIHRQEMTLAELAEAERLLFSLERIAPFARWITPDFEPKRFDTRFFLARMPVGQTPLHDAIEMTETLWTPPGEALRRQAAGDLLLFPPTLKTLEEISRFSSLPGLFSFAAARPIRPILPQALRDGTTRGIKLPHDPEYTIEAYKQPHRPGETSRIVLQDGRFTAMAFEQ
ncbi:MAG: hypothetical protein ACOZF0_23895 [Thermodesulfobacteriota bacterium]